MGEISFWGRHLFFNVRLRGRHLFGIYGILINPPPACRKEHKGHKKGKDCPFAMYQTKEADCTLEQMLNVLAVRACTKLVGGLIFSLFVHLVRELMNNNRRWLGPAAEHTYVTKTNEMNLVFLEKEISRANIDTLKTEKLNFTELFFSIFDTFPPLWKQLFKISFCLFCFVTCVFFCCWS